jgi:hypothetical protein
VGCLSDRHFETPPLCPPVSLPGLSPGFCLRMVRNPASRDVNASLTTCGHSLVVQTRGGIPDLFLLPHSGSSIQAPGLIFLCGKKQRKAPRMERF